MSTLKIIQIGVGPIGQKVVNYLLEREGMEVVAAVDPAPDKSGKDLGEVCGLDKPLGIIVSPNLADAMKTSKPDVAVLCTTSSMEKVVSQIEEIISHGLHVVSTCEELSYPWDTQPGLSKQLDKTARQAGVAVLGTGVNPGFLMDFLPLAMTAVCRKVESIKVSRIQDASVRRIPFQQKIGAGLTLEEFEAKKQTGTLRHVGLTESMQMIAARMGWKLDRTEDILTPVVAEREITTGYVPIKPGMAAGVRQIGKGYVGGAVLITLEFVAAVGQADPADTVEITGDPPIKSVIGGGVNGDVATCAITVNAIKSIVTAQPGLRTMSDIAPVTFFEAF